MRTGSYSGNAKATRTTNASTTTVKGSRRLARRE
jgi:hypothetical protein